MVRPGQASRDWKAQSLSAYALPMYDICLYLLNSYVFSHIDNVYVHAHPKTYQCREQKLNVSMRNAKTQKRRRMHECTSMHSTTVWAEAQAAKPEGGQYEHNTRSVRSGTSTSLARALLDRHQTSFSCWCPC